jgi:hypothetical protein
MSTTTKAPTKVSPPAPRKRSVATPAKPRKRVRRSNAEQDTLAAMANAKAKPAARITGVNIKRLQSKLGGKSPSEYLGITPATLARLANGSKVKAELPPAQRIALRDLGSSLGSDTFYGRKLAGMLWAVEKGVSAS